MDPKLAVENHVAELCGQIQCFIFVLLVLGHICP